MVPPACRIFLLPLLFFIAAGLPPCALALAASAINVQILGVNQAQEANIRESLSLLRALQKRHLEVDDLRALNQLAPAQIQAALAPFGYYSPSIDSQLREVTPDHWQVSYQIDPGPATRLRQVDIRLTGAGSTDPALQALIDAASLKPGQRLQHARYEDLKNSLQQAALERGYFDARFPHHTLSVNPLQHWADIDLEFATGPRYRIGALQIDQSVLTAKRLAPYIQLQPGEPFMASTLLEQRFLLEDSGYFTNVDVLPDHVHAQAGQVPIVIKAPPNKRNRYTMGLGYGTDTGPRIDLGIERRWVNRQGHRLRGDVRVSQIKNTISAQYLIPVGQIQSDYYAINLDREEIDELGDGSTRAFVLSLQRTQPWHDWVSRLQLRIKHERSEFGGLTQSTTLVMPEATLSRISSDNVLFPTHGWSLLLSARGASDQLLSNTSFAQLDALVHYIRPLGARSRLLLRGKVGVSWADSVTDIPASARYFSGGDQSVRGYSFQTLGPRDDRGLVIGGKYLLELSIEADHYFVGNWGGAIFFDAGNASNNRHLNLQRGVGLGLRYRSPVGVIRVDLAHPLDDADEAPDLRLHVSIGSDL